MHRQHAQEGLICMSVSVDNRKRRDAALGFLQKQGADFSNFWLDERDTLWQDRWVIQGPPAIFIFDRQGRRAARYDSENPKKPYTHRDVERVVKKLLAAPSG